MSHLYTLPFFKENKKVPYIRKSLCFQKNIINYANKAPVAIINFIPAVSIKFKILSFTTSDSIPNVSIEVKVELLYFSNYITLDSHITRVKCKFLTIQNEVKYLLQ